MDINLNSLIYAGYFLDEDSKEILKDTFCTYIPDGAYILDNWTVYLDHCTMLYNNGKLENDPKAEIIIDYINDLPDNTEIKLVIDGIGHIENIYAFKVKKTAEIKSYCMNENPHITICLQKPNKPVDSNKIKNWINIEPIKVNTNIKIISKHKK